MHRGISFYFHSSCCRLKRASDKKWSYAFVQRKKCNCTRDWILIRKSVNRTSLLVGADKNSENVFVGRIGWNNAIGSDLRLLSFRWCYWCWYGGREMFILWQNKEHGKSAFDVNWIENIKMCTIRIFFIRTRIDVLELMGNFYGF